MAFKSILFVSLLVVAVVIPLAQSQIIPALLSVIRIDGILYCTANGNVGPGGANATPVFANATVQLQCGSGNNVVSTVTTNGSGVYSILLDPINYLLSSLLSSCRLVVTTPLASCNVSLSPTGILMLNIGSMSTGARVLAVRNDLAKLQLTSPVCTSKGEKIALSRRVEKHWRLIGWGQIQAGTTLDIPPCPI